MQCKDKKFMSGKVRKKLTASKHILETKKRIMQIFGFVFSLFWLHGKFLDIATLLKWQ